MSEEACSSRAKIFNETLFLRTTVYPNARVPNEINTTGRQMLTPKQEQRDKPLPSRWPQLNPFPVHTKPRRRV